MATVGTLLVKIGADTGGLDSGLTSMQTKLRSAGQNMQRMGKSMTVGLTAPLLGAAAAASHYGTALNKAMGNVQSLGLSIERTRELRDVVQELAIETGKGTTDMAGGLYQVVSAFGDSADTAAILEINAKAATAGLATTEDAIALTSAVTKGYGDVSAEAVQKVSDLAFVTVQLGQTTFPELSRSMGRVVPLAAALGVAQEELFATMATATGVTGSASEVSTQLRGVLQSLMAPTATMTALFEEMGVETGQAMLESQGLFGTIEAIILAAEASGVPLQKYIGSIEGQTLALALAGPQAGSYAEKLAAMEKAAGATDAAFQAQTEGINAAGFAAEQAAVKWEVFWQKIDAAMGPTKLVVVEALEPMADSALALANAFAELDPTWQLWIVGALGAVAAAGPLLVLIGQIAAGASLLSGPLVLAAAAIAAVGVAAYVYKDDVLAFGDALLEKLQPALDRLRELREEFELFASAAVSDASEQIPAMMGGVGEMQAQVEAGFAVVRSRVEELAAELGSAFETEGWTGLYELGKGKLAELGDALVAGLGEMQQTALLGLGMAGVGFQIQMRAALAEADTFLDESGVRAWVERTTEQAKQWAEEQFAEGTQARELVDKQVARVTGVLEKIQGRMEAAAGSSAVENFNAAVVSVIDVMTLIRAIKTEGILLAAAGLSKVAAAIVNFGTAVVKGWDADSIAEALGGTAQALADGLSAAFEGADLAGLGTAAGTLASALATKLGEVLGSDGFGAEIGDAMGRATVAIAEGAQQFAAAFAAEVGATDWSQFGTSLSEFVKGFVSGLLDATLKATFEATAELGRSGMGMGRDELTRMYAQQMGAGEGSYEIRGLGRGMEEFLGGFVSNMIDWESIGAGISAALTEPPWVTELKTFELPMPDLSELKTVFWLGAEGLAQVLAEYLVWPEWPKWPEWPEWKPWKKWVAWNDWKSWKAWNPWPKWPAWPALPEPGWVAWLRGKFSWGAAAPSVGGISAPKPGGYAAGGQNVPGGWSLVGETGPELVHLPRGADVYAAGDTREMLGGGELTVNMYTGPVASELDMEALAYRLAAMIRRRG